MSKLLKGRKHLLLDQRRRYSHSEEHTNSSNWLGHSVIEDWRRAYFEIHLHFVMRRSAIGLGQLKNGNYCILLHSPVERSFAQRRERRGESDSVADECYPSEGDQQGAMLIPVTDRLKYTEGSQTGILPAVIGLKALDQCSCAWVNRDQAPVGFALEVNALADQRELDRFLLPLGSRIRKRKGNVIESGAQIVRGVSDSQPEVDRYGLNAVDIYNQIFDVLLERSSIEVRFKELARDCLGTMEVLFRPTEFGPYRLQSVHRKSITFSLSSLREKP
jgi:hypothetical protein